MKRSLLLFALLPSLAWGQVLSRPGVPASGGNFTGPVTFTEPITTPGVTSTGLTSTRGITSSALLTPVNGTFTAGSGTLGTATYYYRVTALNAAGETLPSTETSLAVTGPAGVNVTWGAVTGAASYKIYGRSTGAELYMATVTAPTVTWTDNGSVTPSGAMPTEGTSASITTPSRVSGLRLDATAASGAVALSGVNGSKFCPGATTACITSDGTNMTGPSYSATNITGTSQVITPSINSNNLALTVRGGGTNNATAVAVTVKSYPDLTTEGARIVTLAPDNANTIKAGLYIDGALWLAPHALGTCGDATNPEGKFMIVPGATTVATKFCLCTYTPTGTVYAWVNLAANNAGTGIGNTTTCP